MSYEKHSSGAFAAGLTGLFLGATAAAVYLIATDKKKQQQLKDTLSQVKQSAAQTLDQVKEKLNQEKIQTEEEMNELRRNGQGLSVD